MSRVLDFWTSSTAVPQEEAFLSWMSSKLSQSALYPSILSTFGQSETLSQLLAMGLQLIHFIFLVISAIPPPVLYVVAGYLLLRFIWSLLKSTVKQVWKAIKFLVKVTVVVTVLVLILKLFDVLPPSPQSRI